VIAGIARDRKSKIFTTEARRHGEEQKEKLTADDTDPERSQQQERELFTAEARRRGEEHSWEVDLPNENQLTTDGTDQNGVVSSGLNLHQVSF